MYTFLQQCIVTSQHTMYVCFGLPDRGGLNGKYNDHVRFAGLKLFQLFSEIR